MKTEREIVLLFADALGDLERRPEGQEHGVPVVLFDQKDMSAFTGLCAEALLDDPDLGIAWRVHGAGLLIWSSEEDSTKKLAELRDFIRRNQEDGS